MLFVILNVTMVKMLTKNFFRELVILNGCEGSLYSHCLRSFDNAAFSRPARHEHCLCYVRPFAAGIVEPCGFRRYALSE